MKKAAIERNFRKLKNQISQIETIARHSKPHGLWEHEATVRRKLKELKEYENSGIRDYNKVYNQYLEVFDEISLRLLQDYNFRSKTDFNFNEVIRGNYNSYVKSGIISVLTTYHIPELIKKEFQEIFPSNPKNEYKEARRVKRKFFLHLGDTNTGKTYNAMNKLKAASSGVYLSPLRILALENYEKLNKDGVLCNLITGEEEVIIEGAKHIACTIEKLDIRNEYDVAIIDEIQMINDDQRGAAWTRALLGLKAVEIHICGALNSKEVLKEILEDCDEVFEIIEYKRSLPLIVEDKSFNYNDAQVGDALVVFSKKKVLKLATYYKEIDKKVSVIYGDLPPEVRRKQYEQFISNEAEILITTDAIGMGVNLPIKRIIFMDVRKFDGTQLRYLTTQEVKQIAGRAGRLGIYDVGYVASYKENQNYLSEYLSIKDEDIESAVIGPSEEILKIQSLPLAEKLAIWAEKEEKLPFYRKMDISEYLIVLDAVKGYKLNEKAQWQLLKIPFDVSNTELMQTFISYIDELFILKNKMLTKPSLKFLELAELETFYQKISLYYSFSKAYNIEMDLEWIVSQRAIVSEEINKLLVKL